MERLFTEEIRALQLGTGETFQGEGILAVTKALLQSGVSYVGGYQGAPVSHLLDVMVQARDYLDELGVHVEACTNEASAAAMLGASINYAMRGAVTWKSIVGTNVASDALSNLASAGVKGGALIVLGEDYGEGASVIQERSHAFAVKSSMCLLDPRPSLPVIVRMVEEAFELSEACNSPAMMELRIRACHMQGSFIANDNRAPAISTRLPMTEAASFLYDRLAHPPATFRQEKLKSDVRMPAARKHILERGLNEVHAGGRDDIGLIVQGGLHASLIRALQQIGLADDFGNTTVPMLILNVVYPLVPEQLVEFCVGRSAVLVIEEGQPEFIEQEIALMLGRAGARTTLHGKDMLPLAGEYTSEVILRGLHQFLARHAADLDVSAATQWVASVDRLRERASELLGTAMPPRPPTFCVGCPERPVFAAIKLVEREVGTPHIAGDIGCHALATFEPFSVGNSILGYGMGLASAAAVGPAMARRTLSIMGDGGFWHNGFLSGVSSALLNQDDSILVIMKNGYTSATGTQDVLSSPGEAARTNAQAASSVHSDTRIEQTIRGAGIQWLRTVHTYRVSQMVDTLREAFTTAQGGLKVIIAEGECQLERQRRIRPLFSRLLREGHRVVRTRFGVDGDVCSGDHSCIRLSGCPSLGLADSGDPLKVDPIVQVNQACVGCGLCGEVVHAAVLCPSFYRAEVVQNPGWFDRLRWAIESRLIGWLAPA